MAQENKRYTFYRKSSFGLSTWTIWFVGNVIYYASAVAEGGSAKVFEEVVEQNQSGRSLQEQIDLQMKSRLSRMLDKGYKATREEALAGATNQLGLVNPMLAHPLSKVATPHISEDRPGYMQIKYDGHRCLVTRFESKMIAYTRKGKLIHTIPHVLELLEPRIPEGVTLDGELYTHGQSLQAISSHIKRNQAASASLAYHIYDIVEDQPFAERWRYLTELMAPIQQPQAHCVPTQIVTSLGSVYEHFRKARADGHEGSMLRLSLRGYEDGKRSDQLLKVKERLDEDFRILDVKPGKNGIGILVLQLNDRSGTFDCTAPGSVPQKQEILINKEKYIRRWVTVLYANKTADGVPFHGVADRFVEEL
jgi:DNA ligase 1